MDLNTTQWLHSSRPTIIYGAGRQGGIVYYFCMMYRKRVAAIMTSGDRRRWSSLPDESVIPHALPGDYPGDRSAVDVVVAIGGDTTELRANLCAEGYAHIYYSDDWTKDNEQLRRTFYEGYFSARGAETAADSEGRTYLRYRGGDMDFKLYYPLDEVYRSSLLGDANNIILPEIFGDDSFAGLGPYELPGFAELKRGDVVLDLGANIGQFSCVAAAKGCRVYAVEPNRYGPLPYLRLNAGLYESVTVIPKAVGDRVGTVPFYYNDKLQENTDTGRGSLFREKEPKYAAMDMEGTTVDQLVEALGLKRVDFIKSHIEDAEPLMLRGAQKTLREYSPKLAFFRAGEPGDELCKEVEKLILDAQPRYRIRYAWRRVFASV